MAAPADRFETERLLLRRPRPTDIPRIFERYASDPEVTRYLGWPRHTEIQSTRAFLDFSNSAWDRWPAGPLLIESRETAELLGSTGIDFETPFRASTGYVLARTAWRKGYATEALQAIVEIARKTTLVRLYALCHTEHTASTRVLEKCQFSCEGILRRYTPFPNLSGETPCDVFCYSLILR